MAEDLIDSGEFYERVRESSERLKSLGSGGRARPLFKEFREYSYEPERCKNCEKLRLAEKEGVDYRLTGYRLESPVGLFVLEGCNLRTVCPYKKRTFVVKCLSFDYHDVERITEELEDRLLGLTDGEESEFWSQFKTEEEGFEKAKEVLRTFFLFNRPELVEKVLSGYPFPEHFNDIFELFVRHDFGGILAFPYMSYVWCVQKQRLFENEMNVKDRLSGEEFIRYFYALPYENMDLFYFNAKGTRNGFMVCMCLVKKCFITSFYNVEVEQAKLLGLESRSVAELQTVHAIQHWGIIGKLNELFEIVIHNVDNDKRRKIGEIFDLLKSILNINK